MLIKSTCVCVCTCVCVHRGTYTTPQKHLYFFQSTKYQAPALGSQNGAKFYLEKLQFGALA